MKRDWFSAGLEELTVPGRTRALNPHKRAHKIALARWAGWRRFLRRHGLPVPLFMTPWERGER